MTSSFTYFITLPSFIHFISFVLIYSYCIALVLTIISTMNVSINFFENSSSVKFITFIPHQLHNQNNNAS